MWEALMLLGVMAAAAVGGNDVISLAAALALLLKQAAPATMVQAVVRRAVDLGVLFLVLGLLLPLAEGQIPANQLARRLFGPVGLISMAIGAFSTWLGAEGVSLMRQHPESLLGLVVGSLVGVAGFGGIPTGPLVAAGLAAVMLRVCCYWWRG